MGTMVGIARTTMEVTVGVTVRVIIVGVAGRMIAV